MRRPARAPKCGDDGVTTGVLECAQRWISAEGTAINYCGRTVWHTAESRPRDGGGPAPTADGASPHR